MTVHRDNAVRALGWLREVCAYYERLEGGQELSSALAWESPQSAALYALCSAFNALHFGQTQIAEHALQQCLSLVRKAGG